MTDKAGALVSEHGVFELAGPRPSWIWAHTCSEPKCDCRDALVLATYEGREVLLERGAAIHQAWVKGRSHQEQILQQKDLLHFNLNIDTGEVYWKTRSAERLDVSDHPRIGPIAKCIDGEVLDRIDTLWYHGKGLKDPEQRVLDAGELVTKGWQRGGLIAWHEVFAGVRKDIYVLGRHHCEAAELYCPVPDCECGKVVIHFAARLPRGAPHPGSIVVLSSGAARLEPRQNGSARLEELWTAFCARYPQYSARFARRYRVLKCVGARFVRQIQAATSATKVGRNEPCPCGSGKKYKKCCGAT